MSEQEQAQLDNLVGSTLDKVMQAISAGIDAADFSGRNKSSPITPRRSLIRRQKRNGVMSF